MSKWVSLAERILSGGVLTREEALEILALSDAETPDLLGGASVLREHFHGRGVKLHVLCNAKSGLCPEDCAYCSQSIVSKAPIARYRLLQADEIFRAAERATRARAWKFCIVLASRGPNDQEMETVTTAVRSIKKTLPVRVCASLGCLTEEQARVLRDAGVDRFNHNLETSRRFFPSICRTHSYEDRVRTVQTCRANGLGTCCGGIVGMGESPEDVVDLAFSVRDLNVDSIPVNFLNPIPGTPLGTCRRLTPGHCLRVLALFRFANPSKDIRAAGGREVNLRSAQGEALRVVNSIFTNGYLTTAGRGAREDLRLIEENGYEIVEPPRDSSGP